MSMFPCCGGDPSAAVVERSAEDRKADGNVPRIIVPLYVYPAPGAWDPLAAAIAENPEVTFLAVVNPDSGPGAGPLPDARYRAALPTLTHPPRRPPPSPDAAAGAHGNAVVLGYVHTQWGRRPSADVLADVDRYARWAEESRRSSSAEQQQQQHGGGGGDSGRDRRPPLRVDGIFFDESAADAAAFGYFRKICEHVRGKASFRRDPPRSRAWVVLNPGTPPHASYFEIADVVVTFENAARKYSPVPPPAAPSAVSVIGYGVQPEAWRRTLDRLVQNDGVGNVFLTDADAPENVYGRLPVFWSEFVRRVAHHCEARKAR